MSLIFTPGQIAQRAELYQQLGQLTNAGIDVLKALETCRRNPPARTYANPLKQVIDGINSGLPLTQAILATKSWLPDFDIALIQAGENTGRLDASFHQLAAYYFERARIARSMISQLFYPFGLVHFAAFVFMIVLPWARGGMNFDASLVWLIMAAGLKLCPLYILTATLVFVFQSKNSETWRSGLETVLHYVPILGRARQELALARLATALEALISAGVNIVEAWSLAANACGSPAYRRMVNGWSPLFAQAQTPAQIIRETSRFPDFFCNLYTSGEVSGKLEESLHNIARYYQEEGSRKLHTLTNLLPKVIYVIVMIVIGCNIIKFYTAYFGEIQKAGGF